MSTIKQHIKKKINLNTQNLLQKTSSYDVKISFNEYIKKKNLENL